MRCFVCFSAADGALPIVRASGLPARFVPLCQACHDAFRASGAATFGRYAVSRANETTENMPPNPTRPPRMVYTAGPEGPTPPGMRIFGVLVPNSIPFQ